MNFKQPESQNHRITFLVLLPHFMNLLNYSAHTHTHTDTHTLRHTQARTHKNTQTCTHTHRCQEGLLFLLFCGKIFPWIACWLCVNNRSPHTSIVSSFPSPSPLSLSNQFSQIHLLTNFYMALSFFPVYKTNHTLILYALINKTLILIHCLLTSGYIKLYKQDISRE